MSPWGSADLLWPALVRVHGEGIHYSSERRECVGHCKVSSALLLPRSCLCGDVDTLTCCESDQFCHTNIGTPSPVLTNMIFEMVFEMQEGETDMQSAVCNVSV